MKIVKTILFVLFALMFINAGMDKFFHYMPMPEFPAEMMKINEAMMTLKWILPLVATIEILAGILVLMPKTRALGAVMIFPVMIGILCHNATFMPEGLLIAGVFFAINIWILIDNKEKIKHLIS
ncbi:DoxX protein [Paenimyroides ummariense]|uniref:DoxX protein n=1 Tax=Paenimyroides ummariense TaxID=913024 RepID=A0A1I4YU01_9FLAO|nr:MauE/DoxX family redox-associated membrane protein [Paenimyroides ummariense]SFN41506.1 DoxX protein [Paenimyroides ummariense]